VGAGKKSKRARKKFGRGRVKNTLFFPFRLFPPPLTAPSSPRIRAMSIDIQHFRLKMGTFCTPGLENRVCYLEEVSFPRLTSGDIRNLSLMFMIEQLGKLWWQRTGGGGYQFGEIPPENTSKGKLRENDNKIYFFLY